MQRCGSRLTKFTTGGKLIDIHTQIQLTSKYWYALVKNNNYFELKISDELLNGTTRFENVAAHKCEFVNLSRHLKTSHLFALPKMIEEITLCENVSKDNFLSIASLLSGNDCLNSVIITQGFLECKNALFSMKTRREKSILERFWKDVTKLVLDVPQIAMQITESRQVTNLRMFLENVSIPKLEQFKLIGHWRLIMDILPFNFLRRHSSSVTLVHVKLAGFGHKEELEKCRMPGGRPKQLDYSEAKFVQLSNLIVEGKGMCEVGWYIWTPVLSKQRRLVHLKISDPHQDNSEYALLSFTDVILVALENFRTITSIHLLRFNFGEKVYLDGFRCLYQFKSLTLDKKVNGSISNLFNMTCLPASLETLIIRGLACEYKQLEEFSGARHLNKLRHLELAFIGSHHKTIEIPEGIIQAFLEKDNLFKLHLSPVRMSRVWTDTMRENKRQYFVVSEQCYLVPLRPNFHCQNESNFLQFVNLAVYCKDARMMSGEERVLWQENWENVMPEL